MFLLSCILIFDFCISLYIILPFSPKYCGFHSNVSGFYFWVSKLKRHCSRPRIPHRAFQSTAPSGTFLSGVRRSISSRLRNIAWWYDGSHPASCWGWERHSKEQLTCIELCLWKIIPLLLLINGVHTQHLQAQPRLPVCAHIFINYILDFEHPSYLNFAERSSSA